MVKNSHESIIQKTFMKVIESINLLISENNELKVIIGESFHRKLKR